MMQRRSFLGCTTAALAMPSIARGDATQVLKFVPQADLAALDPVWTTTYQSRDHGFLVFDTLFGLDGTLRASPQMADGAVSDDGGKTWRITLRPDLMFRDGNCLGCPLMGTIDRSRPSTSQRVDGSARRHTLPRRRNGGGW